MTFSIPVEAFQNDAIYHQFGSDYTNLFGCGYLNKKNKDCNEDNIIFRHYGIVVVLSGNGVYIDEEGTKTQINPGCLIQRIPDKSQTLSINPDGTWLEFFICIGKEMYEALLGMELLDCRQDILFPGLSHAMLERLEEFHMQMKESCPTEINILIPKALEIILMLHTMHRENNSNSIERELIKKACLILSAPSATNMSMKDVAKELGMGYEKFRKLFKQQMTISPANYLMQKRMDLAKTFLITNSKSIKEIALELGFTDAYAFSKQFSKNVGISPSQFRKIY